MKNRVAFKAFFLKLVVPNSSLVTCARFVKYD